MTDWHDDTGEQTSVWKKEISFRRKVKEEKPAPAPEEKASIWKKEIRVFGDKAKAEEQAPEPASVWKKEISFRRKPREEKPAAAPEEKVSFWKKEIHVFGDKAKAEAPPEPAAATVPAAVPEAPVTAALEEPASAPELPAVAPEPPALAPEPPSAPAQSLDHSWLTAPLEEVSAPPEGAAERPVRASGPGEGAPGEPGGSPPPLAVPEPPAPAAVLPPLEAAAPVPARAPQPAEPKQEKVPLLKRELSFKRKPKAEAAPKPEKQKREKVPLLKRELSLKRKPREERVKEPRARKPARSARPKRERGAVKEKRLVGLKIGASQIAAARVANNGSPELLQAVRMPLEPGIVVGGELRDPEALAAALRDFFRKNKLPKKGVRLGVANNRIGVRTFEITGIDDPKQLENAVRYRAQEVLPIPLEESVLDYQILSETIGPDGQTTRRILLVVAYRDLVDRYVNACRKAGINLVGIDLEAFALLRALAPPHDAAPGNDRAALVAVSVGHDRSTFAVSDGRVCEFTRVLEWGGYSLDVGIARALDLTPVEAAEIKRALSLAAPGELPEGLSEEHASAAREAVQRQLQTFARELVSSLQFYQSQPGSLSIGQLVLTGGTAHMTGLAAELERLIGVPVRIGDPLGRVKVSKRVRERDQIGSLTVAIGLGIED